jgi:hypothetical protein
MNLKKIGFIMALAAAFATGTKAGVEYAKNHYVARGRKFIEGKTTDDRTE